MHIEPKTSQIFRSPYCTPRPWDAYQLYSTIAKLLQFKSNSISLKALALALCRVGWLISQIQSLELFFRNQDASIWVEDFRQMGIDKEVEPAIA